MLPGVEPACRRIYRPCGGCTREDRRAGSVRNLCGICYTLRWQDGRYFAGLREAVLARDGYRCRVCDAPGRAKRSILVHHRVPGKSSLPLMIALCPGCHARVHRTQAALRAMPSLLRELWREQHPQGPEQRQLDFSAVRPRSETARLFAGNEEDDLSSTEYRQLADARTS